MSRSDIPRPTGTMYRWFKTTKELFHDPIDSYSHFPDSYNTNLPHQDTDEKKEELNAHLRQVRTRSVVGGYCFPAHQPVDFREDALESRVDTAGVKRRRLKHRHKIMWTTQDNRAWAFSI